MARLAPTAATQKAFMPTILLKADDSFQKYQSFLLEWRTYQQRLLPNQSEESKLDHLLHYFDTDLRVIMRKAFESVKTVEEGLAQLEAYMLDLHPQPNRFQSLMTMKKRVGQTLSLIHI